MTVYVGSALGTKEIWTKSADWKPHSQVGESTIWNLCGWGLKGPCVNFIPAIGEANIRDMIRPWCHQDWDRKGCITADCVTFFIVTFHHLRSHWEISKNYRAKAKTFWLHTSWKLVIFKVEAFCQSIHFPVSTYNTVTFYPKES